MAKPPGQVLPEVRGPRANCGMEMGDELNGQVSGLDEAGPWVPT